MAGRIEKGFNHAKSTAFEEIETGKLAAGRILKRGRHAIEDGVEEAVHGIKRHRAGSIAFALAAGAALGFLALLLVNK